MMNYLWAGLILLSFLFAVGNDVRDLQIDRYHNHRPLAVDVTRATDDAVRVTIADDGWRSYFGRTPTGAEQTPTAATVVRGADRVQLQIRGDHPPAPLDAIRKFHDADDKVLVATAIDPLPTDIGMSARVRVTFEPVRFARLRAINDAAVQFAQKAFEVVIGLVGGLTLWLGLLKIADDSGLVNLVVKLIRPVIGPLFPDVPRSSPALGLIALNIAANMLALGNAATPIGIKAMQELQKLNPRKDTATNAMCMLLAINTASVTLLPSPSLVGILGPRIGVIMGPIIATTSVALAVAIVACKLLERRSRVDPIGDESPTPSA